MRRIIKLIGIFSLTLFSFYYVEKLTNKSLYSNQLFQTIKNSDDNFEIKPVNATIDNDNITPGLEGRKVNIIDSYYKMRSFNTFNEYYLVFYKIKPDISIENNKSKIIKRGNDLKKQISFILDNNTVEKYFEEQQIPADILITYEDFNKDSKFEQINNDIKNFKNVNKLLFKNGLSNNICFINDQIIDFCKSFKYYLVDTNIYLKSNNIVEVKKLIESGNIIYITTSAKLEDVKILLNEINFKNLDIVFISKLISEQRD